MSRKQKKQKRPPLIKRLYHEQKGRCYYCNNVCILSYVEGCEGNRATKEHLYPKGDIRRWLFPDNTAVVMACYNCNHERGKAWGDILNKYVKVEEINILNFIQ